MINLEEILVVNVTGLVILFVLLKLRVVNHSAKNAGDYLFELMVVLTVGALVLETVSFLLDGKPGRLVHAVQYLFNGYLFFASCAVGMVWVLYVDYQIYRSLPHLKKRLFQYLPLFLIVVGMLLCDLFGAGLIFSITEENVYLRGNFVMVPYLVLYFYYGSSFFLAIYAVRRRGHVQFFPIHYFVTPALVGTITQGMFYGLAAGWFSLSLALMFIRMQLQNQNTFVDDLSGLYNRKFYLYYICKIRKSRKYKTVSGIMLDVNHFKSINDQFGHTMGDDAIRSIGQILSEVTAENGTAFRLSGDEFVVISDGAREQDTLQLMERIRQQVELFDTSSGRPYQLSLAMGYTICEAANLDSDEFLRRMDMKMYEAKAAYYSQAGKNRRRSRPDNEN